MDRRKNATGHVTMSDGELSTFRRNTSCRRILLCLESEVWIHASSSIAKVANLYKVGAAEQAIGRANRLLAMDDGMQNHGYQDAKQNYKRLHSGLEDVQKTSGAEMAYKSLR